MEIGENGVLSQTVQQDVAVDRKPKEDFVTVHGRRMEDSNVKDIVYSLLHVTVTRVMVSLSETKISHQF